MGCAPLRLLNILYLSKKLINSGHLTFKEKNRTRLTRTMNNIDIKQVRKVESSTVGLLGLHLLVPTSFTN
jgi:hypothetical protein